MLRQFCYTRLLLLFYRAIARWNKQNIGVSNAAPTIRAARAEYVQFKPPPARLSFAHTVADCARRRMRVDLAHDLVRKVCNFTGSCANSHEMAHRVETLALRDRHQTWVVCRTMAQADRDRGRNSLQTDEEEGSFRWVALAGTLAVSPAGMVPAPAQIFPRRAILPGPRRLQGRAAASPFSNSSRRWTIS